MEQYDQQEYEEFETLTMTDEETGEEVEFAIIDNIMDNNTRYLLVIESELIDDDQADAIILKEASMDQDEDQDDITYTVVEEEEEFDRVADLFAKSGEDYDIEIDEY